MQSLYTESEEPPLNIRRAELTLRYYSRLQTVPNYENINILQDDFDNMYINNKNLKRPLGMIARKNIDENHLEINIMPHIHQKIGNQ